MAQRSPETCPESSRRRSTNKLRRPHQKVAGVARRAQQHRERESRPGRCLPVAPEPATPGRLVLRHHHEPLLGARPGTLGHAAKHRIDQLLLVAERDPAITESCRFLHRHPSHARPFPGIGARTISEAVRRCHGIGRSAAGEETMPELPEVESIRRGLAPFLEGATIERAEPHPDPGEIRVRVLACGVCRTDLHLAEGDLPPHGKDVVPGHEVVGIVDERGAGTSRFELGQRIGIAWLRWTCGTCRFCARGDENLCLAPRFTGWDADGGFAEYAVVDERYAYELPDAFTDEAAAPLLCAGITTYSPLRHWGAGPGKRVAVVGSGPAGLAATRTPASDVMRAALGEAGARLIAAGIAISTLGFLSQGMLTAPRVYYAMAENGLFFKSVARLHPRTRVPVVSMIVLPGAPPWSYVVFTPSAFSRSFSRFHAVPSSVSLIREAPCLTSRTLPRKRYMGLEAS